MKNSLVRFLFLITLIFTSASISSAWDDTGHKLTAYIAWEQMSPQARERAIKILLSAPEDSHLSAFYLQNSRSAESNNRELFMLASTWADIVRDRKFPVRFAKYHKGDWHYADTFWRITDNKVDVLKDFAEPKGKAVEQLFAFDKLMRDAAASDTDKAIALAWILHLGGDIHQPLHTSARVTQYDPKGDQGGNLFLLSPKGAKGDDRLNLHWFWDSIVMRNIARQNDACDTDYLPPIAQAMMKKYPQAKMQSRLKLGKFDDWQQEGFQIASTKFYPASLKFGEPPPEEYKKMAFEIAEEQIALAGYRMGAMLNQIFGNQASTSTEFNKDDLPMTSGKLTREEYEKDKAKFEKQSGENTSIIGKGINDSWLWFKIRSALMTTNELRDSIINVDVIDSVVTLKGSVSNKAQKRKAISVAKSIDGVKALIDNLKIISK